MNFIQVNSGNIKGLTLRSLKNDSLRPTKDRIKKSVFDILRFEIKDKIFLDLFGGTGQIGIEALSQGAKKVIIVENDNAAAKLIEENLKKIKSPGSISLFKENALDFLNEENLKIDIAFLDPPYEKKELLQDSIKKLSNLISPPLIILTETLSCENITLPTPKFYLKKKYNYGKISLNLYKKLL